MSKMMLQVDIFKTEVTNTNISSLHLSQNFIVPLTEVFQQGYN